MAKLSAFGKFFVNRSNEGNSRRFLDTIGKHLSLDASSRFLEIGGGRGFLSYLIYEHYHPGRVEVTDYDPSQVEAAKVLFESRLDAIPPSIEFRTADALDLPFENETF